MLIAMAIGAVVPLAGSNLVAAEPVTFEKHVRPILKTHCFLCHGEAGVTKGKLDLRLRRLLVRGGRVRSGDRSGGTVRVLPVEPDQCRRDASR